MSSLRKIFRSGVIHCRVDKLEKVCVKSMTSTGVCGGSKHSDNSGDGDEKKVCPICERPDCNACSTHIYDSRKYGHKLPKNTTKPFFEPVPDIPTDVFRCTTGENLGPGGNACKGGYYQNPEYFSFHHMTYYDMHLQLRSYRLASPQTQRKP